MLGQAAAWLDDVRAEHMTRTVTYRRGSDSVELSATVGQTVFRLTDEQGFEVRIVTRDYLIAADDLLLAGSQTEPRRGDRIEETDGGVTRVYELLGPGGEPEWRWSGPNHVTLRVHTKEVG